MSRFFFNFTSSTGRVVDHGGIVLDSLAAAHRHATAIICLATSSTRDASLRGWSVEVTDERGKPLLTVPFFPVVARQRLSALRRGAVPGRRSELPPGPPPRQEGQR